MSRADQPGDADDEPFERAEFLERRSLAGAIREALFDFYHHSIRLVPANVLWGLVLIGLGWGALVAGLWIPILGLPLLGLPLIGIYRLAGHITRGEEVVLSDAIAAARQQFLPALVAAAAIGWSLLLLAFNVVGGLNSGARWVGSSRRWRAGGSSRSRSTPSCCGLSWVTRNEPTIRQGSAHASPATWSSPRRSGRPG